MNPANAKALVLRGLDKGLAIQRPVVLGHIARVRRSRPDAPPAEVVRALEKQYLAAVTALGGAAGASAAVPGPGTVAGTVVSIAEIPTFLEATALFALAVAEVHGIHVNDLERRRTLVMAVILGDAGSKVVESIAGRTGKHWARQLVTRIPMGQIHSINRVLGKNFVTKQGTKQGILVLGRDLPFGFGAVIGAAGNGALGYTSVRAARRAFGPPPAGWPAGVDDRRDDRALPLEITSS